MQDDDESENSLIDFLGIYGTKQQQFITDTQRDLSERFFNETGILLEFATERKRLPKAPGVYFLLNDRFQLCYIGQSNNIKARVASGHHAYNPTIMIIGYYIHKDMEDYRKRLDAEKLFISTLRPGMNERLIQREDKENGDKTAENG